MRLETTLEQRIAIVEQVMGGDGCRDRGRRCPHVVRRILGGDVLQHDFQRGKVANDRVQDPVDEHRFAVENVHVRVGDFAVDQQRQALRLHGFQHRMDFVDVGYAGIGIRGRAGRIELAGMDVAGRSSANSQIRLLGSKITEYSSAAPSGVNGMGTFLGDPSPEAQRRPSKFHSTGPRQ